MDINQVIKLSGNRTGELRIFSTLVDLCVILFIILGLFKMQFNSTFQFLFTFFLTEVAYFTAFETLTGYTIGKFIFRLKVVTKEGEKPQIIQSLIRALLWFIEVNPFLLIFPCITYYLAQRNKTGQRFGDKLSKTYVVRVKFLRECKEYKVISYSEYMRKREEFLEMIPKYYPNKCKSHLLLRDTVKLKIKGVENLKYSELVNLVKIGKKFVTFSYSFNILVIGIEGSSSIYFDKNSRKARFAKIAYTIMSSWVFLLSCLFFGLLDYSIIDLSSLDFPSIAVILLILLCIFDQLPSLRENIKGGIDVTEELMKYIESTISEQVSALDNLYKKSNTAKTYEI